MRLVITNHNCYYHSPIDICQIRLDFFEASLQQPTSAACTDTILDITSGTTSDSFTNNPPSNLCGTLTGQHRKCYI